MNKRKCQASVDSKKRKVFLSDGKIESIYRDCKRIAKYKAVNKKSGSIYYFCKQHAKCKSIYNYEEIREES